MIMVRLTLDKDRKFQRNRIQQSAMLFVSDRIMPKSGEMIGGVYCCSYASVPTISFLSPTDDEQIKQMTRPT